MNIQPLNDRVLLRPITEGKTPGGLYIPATAGERGLLMQVISTGPDCKNGLEPNTCVLVHKFSGVEITHNGTKFYIVKEIDILAKQGE